MKINKSDLVAMAATATGNEPGEVEEVVDALLEVIETSLVAGLPVQICRFGKFMPKERSSTKRRHPATGELVEVPAKRRVVFEPSELLDSRMNDHAERRDRPARATPVPVHEG